MARPERPPVRGGERRAADRAGRTPDPPRRRRPAPARPRGPVLPPWLLPSAIAGLSVLLLVIVFGFIVGRDEGAPSTAAAVAGTTAKSGPPLELPRGGRELLPGRRVVSYAGAPQSPELGALGVGSLRGAIARLEKQSRSYVRKTRPTQPALQLISTVVHADPGENGLYNLRQPRSVIAKHLREARRRKALLILDIQPGRSSFVTETKRLERWLREPDVAIAYDPEWRVQAGEVPGQVIGSVGASELQRSMDDVARIVRKHDLPKKLVLVHRFTLDMVRGLRTVRIPPELQAVMSIDGVGDRPNKLAKYRQLADDLPPGWRTGFKVFYKEDAEAGGVMTPRQVMGLRPRPSVVLYE